jgi:hypothetical protein
MPPRESRAKSAFKTVKHASKTVESEKDEGWAASSPTRGRCQPVHDHHILRSRSQSGDQDDQGSDELVRASKGKF